MLEWLLVALINLQGKFDDRSSTPYRHSKSENKVNVKCKAAAVNRWIFRSKNDPIAYPPDGYTLEKEYDLTTLNLDDWDMGPSWGDYHPKLLNAYYDRAGETIETDTSGIMKIGIKYKPKRFSSDTGALVIPYIRGRLHSKLKFRYGWFEAMIKQPKGKNLWSAFWLTGAHSWPPEIDIFEAYSDESIKYKEGIFPRTKIKPNLHYGYVDKGTKEAYGTRSIPVWKMEDRFVHYACLWEEDRIEIYYDGQLAFKCTDPKILDYFNSGHNRMTLIISNNITTWGWDADEASMEVKDLKVYKK